MYNDTTDIQYNKPYNFLTEDDYVVTVGGDMTVLKRLESSNEVAVYYTDVPSGLAVTYPRVAGWATNIRSSNTITLDGRKTAFALVNFTYQSPEVSGISSIKKYYYLDLSLKKTLFSQRLQITLGVRDVFKTRNLRIVQTVGGVETESFTNNNSRRGALSVKYSFGNNKIKKGGAHSAGGDEQGLVH
jgi:hypothetical protein